jgi:CYTH domain-containing protein/CHAD domain-containing protein
LSYCLDPDLPLSDELRRVALECVDDALGRLAGLDGDGVDSSKAVHEVRKRCKELRGLVRLLRPVLGDGYRPFSVEVREAARELSPIRDAQVLLSTVERLQSSAGPKHGGRLEPVRSHQRVLAGVATHDLRSDDPRLIRARARLQAARVMIDSWPLDDDPATIAAGLGRTYRAGHAALKSARKHPDDDNVHEWRKSVKYLWYQARLVEPRDPERIGPLVKDLDRLSDLLGDDHDLAVLAAQLRTAASTGELDRHVAKLGIRLAIERQSKLRSKALRLGRTVYASSPSAFTHDLTRSWTSRRAGTTPSTVERERTYLVTDLPDLPGSGTGIRQGYLAVDGTVAVRVRDAGAGGRTLTIKGGLGARRTEVEWPVDDDRFEALWELTVGRRLAKTRYRIEIPGATAELDLFDGALTGLVVVEVEFDDDEQMQAFQPPPWFGLEVTDDDRYTNASLALNGAPAGQPIGSPPG